MKISILTWLLLFFFLGSTISWIWLKNIESMHKYNWSQGVKNYLEMCLSALQNRKSEKAACLGGCVIAIQVRTTKPDCCYYKQALLLLHNFCILIFLFYFLLLLQYWICEHSNIIESIQGREEVEPAFAKWNIRLLSKELKTMKMKAIKMNNAEVVEEVSKKEEEDNKSDDDFQKTPKKQTKTRGSKRKQEREANEEMNAKRRKKEENDAKRGEKNLDGKKEKEPAKKKEKHKEFDGGRQCLPQKPECIAPASTADKPADQPAKRMKTSVDTNEKSLDEKKEKEPEKKKEKHEEFDDSSQLLLQKPQSLPLAIIEDWVRKNKIK